jgi:hypothetical protein
MDSSEIAKNGPQFISKTKEAFTFLTTNFNYGEPTDESGLSKYRHILVYRNKASLHIIEVLNAYHPVDYGFEVNFYHSEADRKNRKKTEMVYYKLKEDQNPDLKFIEEGATKLKDFLNADKTVNP